MSNANLTGPPGPPGPQGPPLTPRGAWSAITNYTPGDIVISHGYAYIALAPSPAGTVPDTTPGTWFRMAPLPAPFASLEFHGHSHTYGGSSNALRGMDARMASALGAEDRNRTKGGAVLCWSEQSPYGTAGNGGWADIYRDTDNLQPNYTNTESALSYEVAGLWEAKRDFSWLWYDWEDIAILGPANLTPYQNALVASISRKRASAVFEETDSSVVYTSGVWANQTNSGTSQKNQSGSGYAQSDASGGVITISVPASFPGGAITFAALCDPNGNGADWSFTIDGAAAGTLTGRNVQPVNVTGSGPAVWATVPKRFTGLAPGAHTIVATTTAVKVNAYFDCWWSEGRTNPLIVIPLAMRLYNYSILSTWPYVPGDSDKTTLDAIKHAVAAQFDSDVITVDIDAVINKQQIFFASDGAHLNDYGHAVAALAALDTILGANHTTAQHVAGGVHPPMTRTVIDGAQNVLEAGHADQTPLKLRGHNAGDQAAQLLDLLSLGGTCTLTVGRTTIDGGIAAVGHAGDIFPTTVAGDFAINAVNSGNSLWLGVAGVPIAQFTNLGVIFSGVALLSNSLTQYALLQIGRIATEGQLGVAGLVGDFVLTAQPGDTVLRTSALSGRALRFGANTAEAFRVNADASVDFDNVPVRFASSPTLPQSHYDAVMPWSFTFVPFFGLLDADTIIGTWGLLNDATSLMNGIVYNTTAAQNDELGWNFNLAAGTWNITVMVWTGTAYAIITVRLDGTTVGTMDCYAATTNRNQRLRVTGISVPTNGKHLVSFKAATKNASGTGYTLPFQLIQFRRTV